MDQSNLHTYVAIIAGGQGTRLFPISHPKRPKQFCQLDEHNTFIQSVVENFKKSIGIKATQIVIVTTDDNQRQLAKDQCLERGVISPNIVKFSPTLGYAGSMIRVAEIIHEMDPDAVIINTPSDQYVEPDDSFKDAIENSVSTAMEGNAAIVGVKVNDIVTAMGCGHAIYEEDQSACFKLADERFVEKPDREKASKLMRQGNSAVNTGINVWKAKTIVDIFSNEDYAGMGTDNLMEALGDKLRVAVGTFKWRDCGTLNSLYEISKKSPNHKNARLGGGSFECTNCRRSLFYAGKGMNLRIAGADDDAVIATSINERPIVIIAKLSDSQKIKLLAEDYLTHEEILSDDFSMGARNNIVLESNVSKEAIFGFVGVNDYGAYVYREPNGEITVVVSRHLTKTS